MRKLLTFFKLYWLRITIIVITVIAIFSSIIFVNYCVKNYYLLEEFTRRQSSGQMALFLPMFVLVHLLSMPLYFGMQYYFMTGGGLGSGSFEIAKTKVRWNEVIGLENAKKEAWELIKLLKDRALLKAVGGKIIKGTLMIGPPGCGKTYLAKSIATESGLPIISTVGSEFVGMFVGQGTARMKSLFKKARAIAKLEGGCIIFIDEIDSFARPRGADMGFGGQMSMNSTINQFLTEMDGLRNMENNIAVIAATNVDPEDLDSAIMRAGRFDRKIHVTRPNLKERKALLDFYLAGTLDFTINDFPGNKVDLKIQGLERLCNEIIHRHNPEAGNIIFANLDEGISWLNDTLLPFRLYAKTRVEENIPKDILQYFEKIKNRYQKDLTELNETELREINPEIEGKILKRYAVTQLPQYKGPKQAIATKVNFDHTIDTSILARKTVWFSPAEIEGMVREAGLFAHREGRIVITMKDLGNAYERVAFGQTSNLTLSDDEKRWVAYHETGHALIYYLIHPTNDVMKATIVPRTGSLGYVFARPAEELHCPDRDYMLADIKVFVASYVVERKKFGKTSAGVGGGRGSDFYTAMKSAHRMVWSYGMGKSGLIGDFSALTNYYSGANYISEKTKAQLDEDVQDILQSCLKDVEQLVNQHWDVVEYFAQELHKKENLEYDEIIHIFKKFDLKPFAGRKPLVI